jgi:hypothetical protein
VRVALARIGVLIVLCSAASAEDRPTGVHGFAKRMFAGIGAEERACRPEVMREIEARDMTALCASFNGSFARFELRWDIELHQKEAARAEPDSEPIVQPLTDWESNGSRHERIYRVEQKAVGVRFEGGGELLLVW